MVLNFEAIRIAEELNILARAWKNKNDPETMRRLIRHAIRFRRISLVNLEQVILPPEKHHEFMRMVTQWISADGTPGEKLELEIWLAKKE